MVAKYLHRQNGVKASYRFNSWNFPVKQSDIEVGTIYSTLYDNLVATKTIDCTLAKRSEAIHKFYYKNSLLVKYEKSGKSVSFKVYDYGIEFDTFFFSTLIDEVKIEK